MGWFPPTDQFYLKTESYLMLLSGVPAKEDGEKRYECRRSPGNAYHAGCHLVPMSQNIFSLSLMLPQNKLEHFSQASMWGYTISE
jgi:hypothetical protein